MDPEQPIDCPTCGGTGLCRSPEAEAEACTCPDCDGYGVLPKPEREDRD
jgi:DnaJ-class molecular chaperone